MDDLTQGDMLLIKEIDDAMLNYEMEVLMGNYGINNLNLTKQYDSSFRIMKEVEKEFIDKVNKLIENI